MHLQDASELWNHDAIQTEELFQELRLGKTNCLADNRQATWHFVHIHIMKHKQLVSSCAGVKQHHHLPQTCKNTRLHMATVVRAQLLLAACCIQCCYHGVPCSAPRKCHHLPIASVTATGGVLSSVWRQSMIQRWQKGRQGQQLTQKPQRQTLQVQAKLQRNQQQTVQLTKLLVSWQVCGMKCSSFGDFLLAIHVSIQAICLHL